MFSQSCGASPSAEQFRSLGIIVFVEDPQFWIENRPGQSLGRIVVADLARDAGLIQHAPEQSYLGAIR